MWMKTVYPSKMETKIELEKDEKHPCFGCVYGSRDNETYEYECLDCSRFYKDMFKEKEKDV